MKNWKIIVTAALLSACGSSNDNNPTTSQLTFKGNGNLANGAVFNGPHAGDTVRAALLDGTTVLDIQKAVIAASGTDPAFSFTFSPAIDTSKPYTVNYWIDSNFATTDPVGGGKCGAPTDDHQWSVPIPAGQTTFTDVHRPASTTNVCSTFTFALTFVADSSYVGPHSGQPYKLALVHGSDTTAEEILTGNVGTTVGANAISAQFSELLVIDETYTVKLWIDSNFGGGTVGTCDPKANDHQWSFTIPSSFASHPTTFTAPTHSGATTVDVCSFFP
ncbi:MAG TPA: hypothetical protein VIV57_09105 [Anaeromyxobacter sp.]